jgi:hypothetical protein
VPPQPKSLEAVGRSSVPPSHWEAAARRQLPSRCGEGTLCSLAPSATRLVLCPRPACTRRRRTASATPCVPPLPSSHVRVQACRCSMRERREIVRRGHFMLGRSGDVEAAQHVWAHRVGNHSLPSAIRRRVHPHGYTCDAPECPGARYARETTHTRAPWRLAAHRSSRPDCTSAERVR